MSAQFNMAAPAQALSHVNDDEYVPPLAVAAL
jgi:hypothetical protein